MKYKKNTIDLSGIEILNDDESEKKNYNMVTETKDTRTFFIIPLKDNSMLMYKWDSDKTRPYRRSWRNIRKGKNISEVAGIAGKNVVVMGLFPIETDLKNPGPPGWPCFNWVPGKILRTKGGQHYIDYNPASADLSIKYEG